MTLNGVMAVTLRYFTEFGKPVFQYISASICGGMYARVTSLLYFVVRVRCRCKESSRSLSHLLMSFLFYFYFIPIDPSSALCCSCQTESKDTATNEWPEFNVRLDTQSIIY